MRTYDVSPTSEKYYRQDGFGAGRNEIDPGNTCKGTSTIMGIDVADWPRSDAEDANAWKQWEDNLTAKCRSPEGKAFMLALDPKLEGTQPNEVWEVVRWAVDLWYPGNSPLIGPRWDWSLREALFGLTRGIPFVPSTWLMPKGHVVMMAGFTTTQEEDISSERLINFRSIRTIIVDDPHGYHHPIHGYNTGSSGYHNEYGLDVWRQYWRGIGVQVKRFVK